jgi:hypothetical protein
MNPSLLPWEVERKRSQILALSRKIDRLIERITRNVRDLGARAE